MSEADEDLIGAVDGMCWSAGCAIEAGSDEAARVELLAVEAAVALSGAAAMREGETEVG